MKDKPNTIQEECLEDLIELIEDFIEFIKNKHKKLTSIKIKWGQPFLTPEEPFMKQITLGQSIPYAVMGFDQHGADFPIPDGTQYSWTEDSGGTVCELSTLTDPNGIAKSTGEGASDVTVGILVTNPDGSQESFVASDALSVVGIVDTPVLSAIQIEWGEPFESGAQPRTAGAGVRRGIPTPPARPTAGRPMTQGRIAVPPRR